MPNHGPRLRRLTTPSARSRIARIPNASQRPSAAGFDGFVGDPVDVSTASGFGNGDGANASRLAVGAGAPIGKADEAAVGSAAGVCVTATGAAAGDDGVQTWSNRMEDGGAPKADV